jgi:eukaryotic-like serine/threonine-protein kinase
MTMSAMTTGEEHLPKPGEVLSGKFRIEKIIGKGGMGAVLAAHHEMLGERVAIKFLLGEIAQNPEALRRFENEAKNAFKIKGEHVCNIMDVGNERGMPFMVMEYLNGEDLSQILEKRGAFPVEEAVDYVLQALEAIAQAHAYGIVHRDLKPANLFLHRRPDGSQIIKVLDFGIAKSNTFGDAGGQHNLTSTKSMLGSPLYMSPEQLRSAKNVDARADIWALGVILYELLTGTVPFNGETLGELFIAILEQPPMPVSHKRTDVPQVLSDAVMRCLQRQIDQRFANVAELAQALAPCAPARSYTSVERVTQALGLPKPSVVMPMSGSLPDGRAAMPSYSGNPNTPNPYAQSGAHPTQPNQFSQSNSGVHQFSPQGGTQLLGQSTNSSWGNTAGGAQPQSNKTGLIAGLAIGGVLLVGLGIGGIVFLTHHSPSASATTTTTDTATTGTAKTADTATATTENTATTPTTTATAPSASTATNATATPTAAATHTAATTTAGTGRPHGTAAAQTTAAATTAPPPTTKPTSTGGAAFDPLKIDRRP